MLTSGLAGWLLPCMKACGLQCEMTCLLVSLAAGGSLTEALQADLTLPEEPRDFLREHLHEAQLPK